LLPPLCTTDEQLKGAASALTEAICHAGRQSKGRASARPKLAAASHSMNRP